MVRGNILWNITRDLVPHKSLGRKGILDLHGENWTIYVLEFIRASFKIMLT
jgi:hypothetical protein